MIVCKLCVILSEMPTDEAEEINEYILDREVSAEFASATFVRFGMPVGTSTVKKHRKEQHNV